jgi:hypothetical protein
MSSLWFFRLSIFVILTAVLRGSVGTFEPPKLDCMCKFNLSPVLRSTFFVALSHINLFSQGRKRGVEIREKGDTKFGPS